MASPAAALADTKTIVSQHAQALQAAAAKLPAEFQASTAILVAGLQAMGQVVADAAARVKPSNEELPNVVKPVADQLQAADRKAHGPRTPSINHDKAIYECMQGLAWVAYTGPECGMSTPVSHLSESLSSAEVFLNRVLMEFRQASPTHKVWVEAVKAAMSALQHLAQTHFPGGILWGTGGAEAAGGSGSKPPAKAPAAGGAAKGPPPPPPPPPPGAIFEKAACSKAAPAAKAGARNELMAQLNQGAAVTAGLRKVTDDMKTKNRPGRSGVVPAQAAASGSAAASGTKASAVRKVGDARGAPKRELHHRRWIIENFCGENVQLNSDEVSRDQAVYLSHCSQCVVQVNGKVNTITMDDCSKVGVVFESVVAAAEIINCASAQVQITGVCPTLNIDKTDGAQVFLSQDTLAITEITTAKSSAINVSIPAASPDEDMKEHPIPEQYISKFVNGKFVTNAVLHSAG